ncbi:MAG: hypothetical protein AB7G93_17820 [Bdellovibrionales bacterium]
MAFVSLPLSIVFAVTLSSQTFAIEPPDCPGHLSAEPNMAQRIAKVLEKRLKREGGSLGRQARGYSIVIATMVASAAATTYVSSSLPPNFQFISLFLGQVTTLGVWVFGAPIWEPLYSGFRKVAFGVKSSDSDSKSSQAEVSRRFDRIWQRTQESYSLNEQMSRNLLSQFLLAIHQNFYEAYRAMNSHNPEYAADQVAEAAVRLRRLFRDIEPDDPSVVAVVRTAFVNHVQIDEEFVKTVERRITALDDSFPTESAQPYYRRLFEAWLGVLPSFKR